mgnify:FL=1
MAYGIDYEGIYYTDHSRNDLGMMDTYKVSLDLADEKDFEITATEFLIPEYGWWYILGTEIGGIVDKYETDSSAGTVKYTGRSFRGLLNSYVAKTYGATRILQGGITDIINELLTEQAIDYAICDAAYVDESIDTIVGAYEFKAGHTVYDAIIGAAASIDMTIAIEFKSDKIIHIIPILKQDHTDYLKYSGIDAAQFQIGHSHVLTNHLVLTSIDDSGNFRKIHMFTNANGTIQPYRTTDTPFTASDYILDESGKVLTGVDEKAEWKECNDSPVEKYRKLSGQPYGWDSEYGDYFYQTIETDSDGTVQVSYKNFEGVETETMTLTTAQPSDWATNFSDYYEKSYDQSAGKYVYNAAGGNTSLDTSSVTAISRCPDDWSYNYGQYYKKVQSGTGYVYEAYASSSKDKYVRMTDQPTDWTTNFTSYYRKVYKKKVTVKGKTTYQIVDTISADGAYYITCKADDDKKGGKIPSFKKRPHYRKDTATVIPKYVSGDCYRLNTNTTAPTWEANRYYSGKKETKAPPFDFLNSYEKVYDHYESMCNTGVEFFEGLTADTIRAVTIDDFNANIGDIVGGTDEMTGLSVVADVTNINITIEKGIVTTDYEIGG